MDQAQADEGNRLIAHLREQIAQLEAAAASAAASASPQILPHAEPAFDLARSMRSPQVSRYAGLSAAALDGWLQEIVQAVNFAGGSTDAHYLRFAKAALSDVALTWLCTLSPAAVPTTWDGFKAAMRAEFQPMQTQDAALERIMSLKQGSGGFAKYLTSFRILRAQLPDTDARSIRKFFSQGLEQTLRVSLATSSTQTIAEDELHVIKLNGALHQGQRVVAASAPSSTPMDLSHAVLVLKSESGEELTRLEEMQLMAFSVASALNRGGVGRGAQGADGRTGGGRSGLPVIKGMTPAEVERRMKAGLCFGCGEGGHSSSRCSWRVPGVNGQKATWVKPSN